MALSEEQYGQIRNELDSCKNPLFFFDDDPDGLCSFLLLYRYLKEGHGIVVKTHPVLDARSLQKVEEYSPDKIFVLDIAKLEQDFIDGVHCPVIWIDHHGPFERNNVKYFNPRNISKDAYFPTSYLCYKATRQDLWIAMIGCIADMHLPDFIEDFRKEYPDINADGNDVAEVYFNSDIGKLIKIFSFIMKGKTSDVMKHIKALTRIESPYEILRQETTRGRFIYKKYDKINSLYETLYKQAISDVGSEKLLVFTYHDDQMSFTGDLANELMHRYPGRVIIVGRKKEGDVRMSIRTAGVSIPPALDKSLAGLQGYGGGHDNACGANVKEQDFPEFLERMKKNLNL
ncbi:DHH family phosphoesterase [Candidatus Woesearchaeota archaeon]|nr:DHH family phosphoesterase [Candidatus Woesearchaeota archaeon]